VDYDDFEQFREVGEFKLGEFSDFLLADLVF